MILDGHLFTLLLIFSYINFRRPFVCYLLISYGADVSYLTRKKEKAIDLARNDNIICKVLNRTNQHDQQFEKNMTQIEKNFIKSYNHNQLVSQLFPGESRECEKENTIKKFFSLTSQSKLNQDKENSSGEIDLNHQSKNNFKSPENKEKMQNSEKDKANRQISFVRFFVSKNGNLYVLD